jgi:hypothetical protein
LVIDPYQVSELWLEKVEPERDGSLWTYSVADGGFGKNLKAFMDMREEETRLLLEKTGGIVICFLRNEAYFELCLRSSTKEKHYSLDIYSWVPTQWRLWKAPLSPNFRRKNVSGKKLGT